MLKTLRGLSVGLIPALALAVAFGQAPDTRLLSRAQALKALEQPAPALRRAGVERLAEIGTMSDANRLALSLHDPDDQVRELTASSMWKIWSRSGDKTTDKAYQQALQLMDANRLGEAVAAFSAIIKKHPEFAEAWNKRATLYFLMGELALSLKDCAEVIKRNPLHFGALSGYGQIYLQMGELERSLGFFERALKVNPNLPGTEETIDALRSELEKRRRNAA